ncbi:MAG: hypothetical protein ACLT74_07570 [Christensenellales bacterium]
MLKAQEFPRTAILCCRPFHARRALLYQTAMPETRFLVPARKEGVNQTIGT